MKLKRGPAIKARKGRNPLTGEEILIKAKPATVKVRAVPLKAPKELLQSN
ncbi:MAG: HU family DNA-binding protein [Pseudomonadota bacterium]|nr:HU family DNA-binding protein [Pseudomonadota bacterium]